MQRVPDCLWLDRQIQSSFNMQEQMSVEKLEMHLNNSLWVRKNPCSTVSTRNTFETLLAFFKNEMDFYVQQWHLWNFNPFLCYCWQAYYNRTFVGSYPQKSTTTKNGILLATQSQTACKTTWSLSVSKIIGACLCKRVFNSAVLNVTY